MVTQVAKQYREQIAVALLAVALVYVGAGLGLLFKDWDDPSADFSVKSALDGYVFTHPVLAASLVIAVLLVGMWGEPSPHARTIVLAAAGIGAVSLVFAVITWIAGFSADESSAFTFAGVLGAGKIVGAFVGLAQIAVLAIALFLAGIALQALPRPVRAGPQWGSPYQPGWQQPGQDWQQQGEWPSAGHPGQPHYPGQPAPWTTPPQGQWGQPSWQHPGQPPGWGQQPPPGWQQPGPGYEHVGGAEPPPTPQSNAERYWRSAEQPESASPTETSGPSHAAAAAPAETVGEDTVAEPGEHRDTAAGPSEQAGADSQDAAQAAQGAAAGGSDADQGDDRGSRVEERDDNSGWWRPSSSG